MQTTTPTRGFRMERNSASEPVFKCKFCPAEYVEHDGSVVTDRELKNHFLEAHSGDFSSDVIAEERKRRLELNNRWNAAEYQISQLQAEQHRIEAYLEGLEANIEQGLLEIAETWDGEEYVR